ncbi:MAG: DUF6607 family protein [Pseudomonadota bacterium]
MKTLACFAALASTTVLAAFPAQAQDDRRFVFSYQFNESTAMAPRGGTSRGTPITLAKEDHPGWVRLQAQGLDDFERDRRAILAMAGGYRASFDFLEMEGYGAAYSPAKPYQSWGTEYVYVVEDRGSFISLQHVLVMSILGEDDEIIGPFVTKHWRQDWTYEDDSVLTYRGFGRWESVAVSDDSRRGTWSQAVWQVDDSPRYEGIGRWRHEKNFSAWESEETARPLPRREFSIRDDYHALVGTNVHTITREGWTHRQDNLKALIDETGRPAGYLAREYGMNRYQRITGFDFTPGDDYLDRTGPFWTVVRKVWEEIVAEHPRFQLADKVDGEKLFSPMFTYAQDVDESFDPQEGRAAAREIIDRYLSIDPDPLGADLGGDSY